MSAAVYRTYKICDLMSSAGVHVAFPTLTIEHEAHAWLTRTYVRLYISFDHLCVCSFQDAVSACFLRGNSGDQSFILRPFQGQLARMQTRDGGSQQWHLVHSLVPFALYPGSGCAISFRCTRVATRMALLMRSTNRVSRDRRSAAILKLFLYFELVDGLRSRTVVKHSNSVDN
jgi:hypothetical protein